MISSEIAVAEYLLIPSQCRSVNGKDKSTRLTALN